MSAYEVLFVCHAELFFVAVGVLTGAAAWLTECSTSAALLLVLGVVLWSALSWLIFAPYARDIWQLPRVVLTLHLALLRAVAAFVLRGCTPTYPEWTFKFELMEFLGKRAGRESCTAYGTRMEIVSFNGMEHVWIRDHTRHSEQPGYGSVDKQRFVVLYYHGGGFVMFAPHFFVDLGNRVRAAAMQILREQHPEPTNISIECFLANYRKSPDHKYPIPQEDALAAYEHVLQTEKVDPRRVILMGDSAGGGLCVSTLLRLKATGSAMPAGALLSCPFVDFAVDIDADDSKCMFALELGYAMVKAFHATPEDPTSWKDAAAVYCDLRGLPPALIQVGTSDTIYGSSIKLFEKAKADGLGGSWELDEFRHMPHAFTVLSEVLLPDAKHGIDHIAAFAVRQFVRCLGS